MNGIIWFGFVIGVIAIYILITLGFSCCITLDNTDNDITAWVAWIVGIVLFLFLAIAYVKEKRLIPDIDKRVAIESVIEESE